MTNQPTTNPRIDTTTDSSWAITWIDKLIADLDQPHPAYVQDPQSLLADRFGGDLPWGVRCTQVVKLIKQDPRWPEVLQRLIEFTGVPIGQLDPDLEAK